MVGHIYQKKSMQLSLISKKATIIQFLNETKFSFNYDVCLNEDGQNQIVTFEILKKDMSKDQIKFYKNSNVGNIIEYEILKKLATIWRVKIITGDQNEV
jgi:hypothetical protein